MNIPVQSHDEGSINRFNFTVHHYKSSIYPSEDQLGVLAQGYDVVRAAVSRALNWGSPSAGAVTESSTSRKGHVNSFTLRESPPAVEFPQGHRNEIKEWGVQVTEDEIYNLDDLGQFIGTEFTRHSEGQSVRSPSPAESKHSRPTPLPAERHLDLGSLYRIIPQPHLHPSPFIPSQRSLKGKVYNKAEPIYIPPYSGFSIPDDARVAWLIPIRGKFPWDGCTSSHLLDSAEPAPLPCESGSKGEIFWTRDSVARYWDFLLELRKVGTLGPLGVSFHASKSLKSSSTVASNITRPSASYPMAADILTDSSDLRNTLSRVDYIKVYLDAPRTFYVRSALDAWSYQLPSKSADGHSQKIRVLKGARLLLLDDGFQPVLVS
ncbi:hypothetical protein M413DRAFT_27645 [Hebeloma cylindrosporum]|uniref:Uncharacterized protein n=1 Tax=Hebeloma cylindrosporum TaxID=76867 RepID=A0A0C2XUD3_HEBCY|nr:hypothetical protein M413DRAFT_27645 [Hebeloma cylindrosporum h7]